MKVYLVGGAVRDRLLAQTDPSIVPGDRDWVVLGETPTSMEKAGFRPVGRDFPVFLHPTTHEEYALARTERKTGVGYQGFTFYCDPSITLEDDLRRRDLTINAMAERDGEIVDPYGGQQDLRDGWLRHVSEAFREDPLRLFRIARFQARLPQFKVHPETWPLLQSMAASGEWQHLSIERIRQELEGILLARDPEKGFTLLDHLGLLAPTWGRMPSPLAWRTLKALPKHEHTLTLSLMALCIDEDRSESFTHLKAPKAWMHITQKTPLWFEAWSTHRPVAWGEAWLKTQALRHEELVACFASVPQDRESWAEQWTQAWQVFTSVDTAHVVRDITNPRERGVAIDRARLAALEELNH